MRKIFENIFGEAAVIVKDPDHPYTFHVPNFIVGVKGALFGLYIPSREEIRFPSNLIKRLALSRVAFPSNMSCILVYNKVSKYLLKHKSITGIFHKIIPQNILGSLELPIQIDSKIRDRLWISEISVSEFFKQATKLYSISLRGIKDLSADQAGTKFVLPSLPDLLRKGNITETLILRKTRDGMGTIIPYVIDVASNPASPEFMWSFDSSDLDDYLNFEMKDGKPVYVNRRFGFINFRNEVLANSLFRSKLIRAYSFSGWVVCAFQKRDELLNFVRKNR